MAATKTQQGTNLKFYEQHLETWLEAFLIAKKAGGCSPGTLHFYQVKVRLFLAFCESQAVTQLEQLSPDLLRRYLLWLADTGHNPGGVHGCYRSLRAFLLWYEEEQEPDDWHNPIKKVGAPKVAQGLQEPLSWDDLRAMLGTCKGGAVLDVRDKAIMLCLLDTGARAAEFLALELPDVDLTSRQVHVRRGKGGKRRLVTLGSKARRTLRAYLKTRQDANPSLWLAVTGERLTYWGLRSMVARLRQESRHRCARASLIPAGVSAGHAPRRRVHLCAP